MSEPLHWAGCKVDLPEIGRVTVRNTENYGDRIKVHYEVIATGIRGSILLPWITSIETVKDNVQA